MAVDPHLLMPVRPSTNPHNRPATILLVLISFVLSVLPCHASEADTSQGLQLAKKVYNRPDGKSVAVYATMMLRDRGHDARSRNMYIYRLKKRPGVVFSLIRFSYPTTIKGTGLLTRNDEGREVEQWIYLPALDRARRISSSHKGGRFVGSDLYYEDIDDREVAKDSHRIVGEAIQGGVKCKIMESTPVDKDNSVYSKRISWIDPKTLIAMRVDFYAGGSSPSKRLIVKRVEKIQGYDTVVDSTMSDLESGHETEITLQKVVYDSGLPDRLFTRHALTDPEAEARYRP